MTTEQQTAVNRGGQHSYVLATIPVEMIDIREQIRRDGEHDNGVERQRELTDTIKEWGILQPLLVKPTGAGGRYRLVAGHRRYKGAVEAGDPMAPCMIWNGRDEDIPLIQFTENTQRQNLSFADKAALVQRLSDQGKSGFEIDRLLHVSRNYANRLLRVLRVPALVSAIGSGLIGESAAADLVGLHDDYAAPLLVLLREGRAVTISMVDDARRRQQAGGATKDAAAGQRGLTDHTRELIAQIDEMTNEGLSAQKIADCLGLSLDRVRKLKIFSHYGVVDAPSLSRDALRDMIAGLAATGLTAHAISLQVGCGHGTVTRILKKIEDEATPDARDAPAPTAESNYFAQPDPDAPTPNAVRSLLPVRPDVPLDPIPAPNWTRPTGSPLPWEEGLLVDVAPDLIVDSVRPARSEAAPPKEAIPTRYVKEPTLADLTVMLPQHPLTKLLEWAAAKGMTTEHLLHDYRALWT